MCFGPCDAGVFCRADSPELSLDKLVLYFYINIKKSLFNFCKINQLLIQTHVWLSELWYCQINTQNQDNKSPFIWPLTVRETVWMKRGTADNFQLLRTSVPLWPAVPWVWGVWWAHWETGTSPPRCGTSSRSCSCTPQGPGSQSESSGNETLTRKG